MEERTSTLNALAIPGAIVIAAGLIAGAIYLKDTPLPGGQPAQVGTAGMEEFSPEIRPVDSTDRIRGNPNAPILLVEYSDYDCPYCKQFHETMIRVMEEYGGDGRVAWVYRHFPLTSLHPNAGKLAEAAECVAELGGNEAFWRFSDSVFAERALNESTNLTRLPEFAASAGVDQGAFNLCYQSGKYNQKVQDSVDEAIAAGGRGTPHNILVVGDQTGVISGAQPYATVKRILDEVLAQIESGGPVMQ